MFLLLIYCSLSKIVYEIELGSFSFYLLPLDVVEIKVQDKIGTFLGYMDDYKDLLFHVFSGEYIAETFDSNKGLAGIYFENQYTLRFINKGIDEIEINLFFSEYLPGESDRYDPIYPIFNLQLTGDLNDYAQDHFIYYLDSSGEKVSYGTMLFILILVTLFIFFCSIC